MANVNQGLDVPLPPEPVPPEVAMAQGQREQIAISQRQIDQLSTITHLIGMQNAQALLDKDGGDTFQDNTIACRVLRERTTTSAQAEQIELDSCNITKPDKDM